MRRIAAGAQKSLPLGHAGLYVGALYVAQALAGARSFMNARWLGPHDYGFWGWLVFMVTFGYHLHLGAQEMMLKDIPALRAQGRMAQAQRQIQIHFTFLCLMLACGVALLAAIAGMLPAHTPPVYRRGWLVIGCVMFLEVLFNFEQVVARTRGAFKAVSATLLLTNASSVALTCWLVISYGLPGLYAVALLTPLIGWITLHRESGYRVRFVWDGAFIRDKVRQGWPVVALGLCILGMSWIDRLIIIRYLGNTAHGYYTLGTTAAFLILLFPRGVADILEPSLHFRHAQACADEAVRVHFLMPARMLAWIMPAVLLLGHYLIGPVLGLLLPDYLPGALVIRVLMWASYLAGLIAMMKSSLVALGRQYQTVWYVACGALVNAIVSLWMVKQGFGSAGVAIGSTLALAGISLGFLFLMFRELKRSLRQTLGTALELYAPYLLLGVPACLGAWSGEMPAYSLEPWLRFLQAGGVIVYIAAGFYVVSLKAKAHP